MKRIFWGSMLFGLGVGLLSASIVALVLLQSPKQDNVVIPDEEIIQRARVLGMIDPTEGNYKQSISLKKEQASSLINEEPVPEQHIVFIIPKGTTVSEAADILVAGGLIEDPSIFIDEARKQNLISKLKPGVFDIKKGTSINEIVQLLFEQP